MDSNLYKCLKDFNGFKSGDSIMTISYCHYCVVKLADAKDKIIYRWDLSLHDKWSHKIMEQLRQDGFIRDLTKNELIKLTHHMTWRIWRNIGSRLNNTGQQGLWFDIINEKKFDDKKPRLLPPKMCYDCMKEGNRYLPKKPYTVEIGVCHVCEKEKQLCYTYYATPLNLTKYGFGFNVAIGMESNRKYYEKKYVVEDWW